MAAVDQQLVAALRDYGAPESGIVSLQSEESCTHLPYLDLKRKALAPAPLPDAVIELEQRPVLYVVRGPKSEPELRRLRAMLAQRGQAEHLAVVTPGTLHVYALEVLGVRSREVRIDATSHDAPLAIPRIALGNYAGELTPEGPRFHERLLTLLTATTRSIVERSRVSPSDALSWVGRALFLRFLGDRGIVQENDARAIGHTSRLANCFATPEQAVATCRWLDATFNGDLLPLSLGTGESLSMAHSPKARDALCEELSKILSKSDEHGQLSFDWDTLDFGHIPVGLLSQVYERYVHAFEGDRARRESIHYTPREIAEYVVNEALFGLEHADRARVLDPAVGAGVFLVAAFRALIRERWRASSKRPDRTTIRRVLATQLTGFDVNESALRLASLSLYLTALELDPSPAPLAALRFENLRGTVLHDVRSEADRKAGAMGLPMLGSLGAHIGVAHRGAYDVVVGNPPWTAWKRDASAGGSKARLGTPSMATLVRQVEATVQRVVTDRVGTSKDVAFKMVDNVPDLPMCWRALEWARPGGRVALALHGRLLFRQSAVGVEARSLLFRAVRVTGILNGAALRNTEVWPAMTAPFCLLFAENTLPIATDTFTFASPVLEKTLNDRGTLRIDSASAHPVGVDEVIGHPTLLKTLYRGSEFDAGLVRKITALGLPTLESYWKTLGLAHGRGFVSGGVRSKQESVEGLATMRMFTQKLGAGVRLEWSELATFSYETLHRPRDLAIYRAPLLLVPESPPRKGRFGRVHFSDFDVAYNQSFFGFSAHGHHEPNELAGYFVALLASDLVVYLALMRSARFGVERDAYQLDDIMSLPVRPFEDLSSAERRSSWSFAESLLSGADPGSQLDEFVFGLYGLGTRDHQTIADTLAVSSPFSAVAANAQRRPEAREVARFCQTLQRSLAPFFKRRERMVYVEPSTDEAESPWVFFSVRTNRSFAMSGPGLDKAFLSRVISEANEHGSSLVICPDESSRRLTIGVLRQYRYWIPTRARLLALDLRRKYEDLLCGEVHS